MTRLARLLIAAAALFGLAVGSPLISSLSGLDALGVVSEAEARMGRPATPVSVAGMGRRTVRRCAAGVYNC